MTSRKPTKRLPPIPADLERDPFEVIVIGAGINGTGIARDAALRGLKVLLLDQGDIGQGTSSRSARMIHGGLRYLEHGDLRLVWESLQERTNLIRIAPHLVHPQPLVIPFYKPNQHRPWKVRLGLAALDGLATLSRSWLGRHRVLSRQAILRRLPGLNPEDLTGAGIMIDAYSEFGERLYVENALSAAGAGAKIITYAPVDQLLVEQDRVVGVRFRDALDPNGKSYSVRAALTINVAGPWVDRVLQHGPFTPRLIGGTKGSFLVVNAFPGAPTDSCFFEAVSDKRQVVVLPWNSFYLIGTTDIRYDADPAEASADSSEIDYLLREANRAFPQAHLTPHHIQFTYAGVRPLPYHPEGAPGSITRKHIIHDHAPRVKGLLSVVGGKYSTFRSLAEEAVDKIFRKLGRKPPACQTATTPLPGAARHYAQFAKQFLKATSLPPPSAKRLLKIYGTRTADVMALAEKLGPELMQPLHDATSAIGAEILFALHSEFAQTLADALLRRTLIAYESAFNTAIVEQAARVAQQYLDWDNRRVEDELKHFWNLAQRFQPRTVPD